MKSFWYTPAMLGPVCVVAALLGCHDATPPFGAVHGRVTCAGQPVPNAVVCFEATGAELSVLAEADEDGVYRARRSADLPGLPPGEYHVAVTPPLFYPGLGPVGSNNAPHKRPDIPLRYRDVTTSNLTITVADGGDLPYDIDMRP